MPRLSRVWRTTAGAAGSTGARRRSAAPEHQPAPELLEAHHPPASFARDPRQAIVGIDHHRVADSQQHRKIGDRVGVGERDVEVDVVLGSEAAHRLNLALAVHEPTAELAREPTIVPHLVGGADPTVHVEDAGEQLDELVSGGADDERRAAGILVRVDLLEHLWIDPGQQADEHLGRQARKLAGRGALEDELDLAEQLLGRLVARSPEAEPQRIEPPAQHLAAPDQPRLGRRPRPRQPRAARDQRSVEVEEGRGAAPVGPSVYRERARSHSPRGRSHRPGRPRCRSPRSLAPRRGGAARVRARPRSARRRRRSDVRARSRRRSR